LGFTTQISTSTCRFCETVLKHTFVDLGMSPLCESYVSKENLNHMEPFYPLHVYTCEQCFLVQLQEYIRPEEIFSEYAYFSSYSDTWLEHAKNYTEKMIHRFNLDKRSFVVEVASNDGYLLQYFVQKNIPVLGVEPARNVAESAEKIGVPTLVEFFGEKTAARLAGDGKKADLLVGNNVLAQVPDIKDFVKGMKVLLKPGGVITMEFPHLMQLMEENQFDTIYHEHFSYFSFSAVERIFVAHGIVLFDVEEIPTHGGSLRIYGRHAEDDSKPVAKSVGFMTNREEAYGFNELETYSTFSEKVKETKRAILDFMISAKREGKVIAGYGAPGKGNTLLNYCGIRTDFIDYTVDRNPYKQGKFLPGTHIPIYSTEKIRETKPDYVFILPWNFKDEIMRQMSFVRDWGAKFVVPIPRLTVLP
jgi:C-methyltransferase C-terminal domain/Putative zinc binding domain/Methyltransferase domain